MYVRISFWQEGVYDLQRNMGRVQENLERKYDSM